MYMKFIYLFIWVLLFIGSTWLSYRWIKKDGISFVKKILYVILIFSGIYLIEIDFHFDYINIDPYSMGSIYSIMTCKGLKAHPVIGIRFPLGLTFILYREYVFK
ncbi:hypothetical protein [Anaeromicrobium sediminis]|uniref:Uncharacterized protein n=1 Tax=Anaeromicrobium sediminis TaxID=1478221 RepID=A0A267MGN0_9FIRM|nr:hypothetical protein [Anaeromicrobium sediminis]PAB58035.1 hypothetical protein CCE28_17010 [Anaeromicrobium sediminis]